MYFPGGIDVFVGHGLSASVVLVVVSNNLGRTGRSRGTVFLSTNEGETYSELYTGRFTSTRSTHTIPVAVPREGGDVYLVNYSRDRDTVAFATVNDGNASSHLLRAQSHLPTTTYMIKNLTEVHMVKIRALLEAAS